MKIWFDLSNSPHINMFAHMIRDLSREHEVLITCRPLANTIDLLELHKLPYHVVGQHYGGKLAKKIWGFPVRVFQLWRFLRNKGVDVAVSQSSFHSPIVARMLGVRSIYMNDNKHALGNIPAFLSATTILVPEFLAAEKLRRQGASARKVIHYPGVKEGIYLWELAERLKLAGSPERDKRRKASIYVRPEPWTAQYYRGSRNFLDELLLGLSECAQVTLLPRGRDQATHYQSAKFDGLTVVTSALDIADIAPDCDLFIGAGGTMTREMAVLGVPTISVYQDELLDVDKYLIAQGSYIHVPDLTWQSAVGFLESTSARPPNAILLSKGVEAYKLIKRQITDGR